MANKNSRPHWSRGGISRSRRTSATAMANRQPQVPQNARIVNGGSSPNRNLVCGQLAPQLQAVNRTRHRPSAREPRKPRLTEIDTDLGDFAAGIDLHTELNAGRDDAVRLDRD